MDTSTLLVIRRSSLAEVMLSHIHRAVFYIQEERSHKTRLFEN